MSARRDHEKTKRHRPMIANFVIFGFAVVLVLAYFAVMHCCWLGRETTPPSA